jgi:hypothetical protein
MKILNTGVNEFTFTHTRSIKLQPSEVIALNLFNQDLNREINTFDLIEAGVNSPAQCVWRLKNKGVVFQSKRSF